MWRRACLIAVVGAVTYATSLSGPFLFDDDASVVENTTIRNLRPSVALQPDRESPTAGRPLVNLTFAINYAIGGLNVAGYHATNIAIHLLCGLVLFGVAKRTLDLPRIPASLRQWSADLAFAITLLWVVHPLNSEAVDYITQRTESLMALFYLLTVYSALRAAVDPASRLRRGFGAQEAGPTMDGGLGRLLCARHGVQGVDGHSTGDLKGRTLASRGPLADARTEFERAVQLDPRDEQARADLALVLRAFGAR